MLLASGQDAWGDVVGRPIQNYRLIGRRGEGYLPACDVRIKVSIGQILDAVNYNLSRRSHFPNYEGGRGPLDFCNLAPFARMSEGF